MSSNTIRYSTHLRNLRSAFGNDAANRLKKERRVTETWDRLYTDQLRLRTQAYANSNNLLARASIYRYQRPQLDLVGWALEQVAWRGDERVLDVGCGPGQYLRRLAQRPA